MLLGVGGGAADLIDERNNRVELVVWTFILLDIVSRREHIRKRERNTKNSVSLDAWIDLLSDMAKPQAILWHLSADG